jgi:phosphate:Na+ symporter
MAPKTAVFFSSDVPSARRLRRNKHRFRILNLLSSRSFPSGLVQSHYRLTS